MKSRKYTTPVILLSNAMLIGINLYKEAQGFLYNHPVSGVVVGSTIMSCATLWAFGRHLDEDERREQELEKVDS